MYHHSVYHGRFDKVIVVRKLLYVVTIRSCGVLLSDYRGKWPVDRFQQRTAYSEVLDDQAAGKFN